MKKINQSGPFGRCLAGDAALTTEDRARVFSMSAEAVAMKRRMEFVFASSDRDALKPDNGDRRFATIVPASYAQMRKEADLVEAHLKALPPLPPVPRELRFLAGGTFGKTSPRPPSHMYQDALDYFEEHAPARTVRLRAFGKSLPGALFRSGDLLQFFDGEYAGNAFIRPGVKRDIAMERVHHHVDAWSVRRRFAGMVDRLPKRLRMAVVIHRAFGGQA